MEFTLNNSFCELSNDEMQDINGGMAPAFIYALGFAMGVSPAGALIICGAAVATGVAIAVASK